MHLPARRVVKIAPQFSIIALLVFLSIAATAQDKDPAKNKPRDESTAAKPAETPAGSQGSEIQGPVITQTDLITLTVTVTDTYGRYVSGLGKGAFTVLDEKKPQEITFFSDDDAPVSVGVIFDLSGSMSGDKIKRAREALAKFVQTSHISDEYFLIGFNSSAQLLLDKTRDGNAVLDKLAFVETRGQTALYDAVYLGVEKVQRGAHPKRALLVISDGQDNNS